MARMTQRTDRARARHRRHLLPALPPACVDRSACSRLSARCCICREQAGIRQGPSVPQSFVGRLSRQTVKGSFVGKLRIIAAFYAIVLLGAASLNYIPGLTDDQGRAFGIFALDIYDDGLHVASAAWAGNRGLAFEPGGAQLSSLFRHALLWRWLARPDHRLRLSRSRHRQSRHSGSAAQLQDPRQPAASRPWAGSLSSPLLHSARRRRLMRVVLEAPQMEPRGDPAGGSPALAAPSPISRSSATMTGDGTTLRTAHHGCGLPAARSQHLS